MKKLLATFLFVVFVTIVSQCCYAQVVVIANPSVKATSITKTEVGDVFTGSSSSLKDGSRVTPVLLKAGAVHNAFLIQFMGKSDGAFRASWRSLVFSGQGAMPKTIDSEAALVEYVASTPGTIGYVGRSTPHDRVKTLAVR